MLKLKTEKLYLQRFEGSSQKSSISGKSRSELRRLRLGAGLTFRIGREATQASGDRSGERSGVGYAYKRCSSWAPRWTSLHSTCVRSFASSIRSLVDSSSFVASGVSNNFCGYKSLAVFSMDLNSESQLDFGSIPDVGAVEECNARGTSLKKRVAASTIKLLLFSKCFKRNLFHPIRLLTLINQLSTSLEDEPDSSAIVAFISLDG